MLCIHSRTHTRHNHTLYPNGYFISNRTQKDLNLFNPYTRICHLYNIQVPVIHLHFFFFTNEISNKNKVIAEIRFSCGLISKIYIDLYMYRYFYRLEQLYTLLQCCMKYRNRNSYIVLMLRR